MVIIILLGNKFLNGNETVTIGDKLDVVVSVDGYDQLAAVIVVSAVANSLASEANGNKCSIVAEFGGIINAVGRTEGQMPVCTVKYGIGFCLGIRLLGGFRRLVWRNICRRALATRTAAEHKTEQEDADQCKKDWLFKMHIYLHIFNYLLIWNKLQLL